MPFAAAAGADLALADVFLSYNREDQQTARLFAERFEANGLQVWWDTTLRAGEAYDEVTEAALRSAKAVVVLWSSRAVASRWVRAEATLAQRNNTLVPCMIEPCERPVMFELTQTADLSYWNGAEEDPRWQAFLVDVIRHVRQSERHGPPPGVEAPKPAPAPARKTQSERRHLTFLSCRLEDPAGAAGRDPEEWHEIIQTIEPLVSSLLEDLGANVTWKSDQVDAVFGYPVAHEDAAERAIRAGLAIVEKIGSSNHGSPSGAALQARVGIHAATTLVGRGRDGALEVFGDGANVALQVLNASPANAVVYSGDVAERVAGLFEQQRLADCPANTGGAPTAVFGAIRARREGHSGSPVHPAGSHFVGRDDELAQLARRWRRVVDGDGQHVLIKGPPGIGKSRLLEEFRSSLQGEPHSWINWHGASLFANTPFYPVVQHLSLMIEADGGEPVEALQHALAAADMPEAAFDLVATMIGLPLPADHAVIELAPVERRRRLLETLAGWVFSLSWQKPLVIVVEDLHWADPSTLELVQMLVEQGGGVPLLLIGAARPEFQKSWPDRDHHGQINLGRLDAQQTRALVAAALGDSGVDEAVIEKLIARTDGVPFFVEELARRLLARGDDPAAGDIPTTLRDLLAARIDRLGAAKETALLGAVLGRSFSYEMIEAIAGIDAIELVAHLDLMAAEQIVQQRGVPPRSTYSFKHALIHEAAYELLPKSRRTREHRRIAEVLLTQFPNDAADRPALVAHHFGEAGDTEQAITWFARSGARAVTRAEFREAIADYSAALENLEQLPAGHERDAREVELRLDIAVPHSIAASFGNPIVGATYARAYELALAIRPPATRFFEALYGVARYAMVAGDFEKSVASCNELLAHSQLSGNPAHALAGEVTLGQVLYWQGHFALSDAHCSRALKLCEYREAADLHGVAAAHPRVSAGIFGSWGQWMLGKPDAARRLCDETLDFARSIDDPYSHALAAGFGSTLAIMLVDAERTQRFAAEALAISEQHAIPLIRGLALVSGGWASVTLETNAGGLAEIERGIALLRSLGSASGAPGTMGIMADAQARLGNAAAALAIARAGLDVAQASGQNFWDAELHRLVGSAQTELAGPDDPDAEAALRRAIAVARSQGAVSLELRSAVSLARMLSARGCGEDARATVSQVLARFPDAKGAECVAAQEMLAALTA